MIDTGQHTSNRHETTRVQWDGLYQRMRCVNCGSPDRTMTRNRERCDGCGREVTNG